MNSINESYANLTIKLDHILLPKEWNRFNIRKPEEMISSIKKSGQLHPLLVRVSDDQPGYVILIDGRRRLYALRELGYKSAKICINTSEEDGEAYLFSLVSNLVREDNTAYEKAITFNKLVTEYGITHDNIATACGKTSGYISQYLSVLKASTALQEALKEEQIPITIFRLFSRIDKEKDKRIYDKLAEGVINNQLTYNELEKRIQQYLNKKNGNKQITKKGAAAHKHKPEIVVTDYTLPEVQNMINPISKDETLQFLTHYSNRYVNATKKNDRLYYEGIIEGLELASGLKSSI